MDELFGPDAACRYTWAPGPWHPLLLHSANLLLRDETGHDRIRLRVADNGDPKIELINGAGELVWSAP